MNEERRSEYINDFLYFSLRPMEEADNGSLIYCSGVNLLLFRPLTRKRHGLCSNPSMRGLQLVNHEVRSMALSRGAVPKTLKGKYCEDVVPVDNGWYRETLIIENAPPSFPGEVINHAVLALMEKIVRAGMLDTEIPRELPPPDEFQTFIEALCRRYEG